MPHLPLGVGVMFGQGLFWMGAVTLAVGRQRLVLNLETGSGTYSVRSPLVEAGKPFSFQLSRVRGVVLKSTTEERPKQGVGGSFDAQIAQTELQITRPRWSIVLDETENEQAARVRRVAFEVAGFLGAAPIGGSDGGGLLA